ncbi:hypothetical protein L2E82_10982 [Cichorium intybus]|uniref:Uncharacterized protein n=1 Tax=Cichorium intybus TaxID=13427 RepID=A0ACB9GDA4_CICIN|nr:hypothetical protein L2E82_10982 [Cichorium intybus]
MEKLIYNPNHHIPSKQKLYLKPRPFLPQLARFQSTKLFNLSHYTLRVNSISCKHEQNPSFDSSSPVIKKPETDLVFSENKGSIIPKPHFLQQLSQAFSHQQKVAITGTIILLSSLIFTIQPLFIQPALASFQTATKTSPTTPFIRSELLTSAWTGFFAGCLHTLSGPDHLAALAPLSIGRSRVESALVGALWGCGHDAGQVIFGLLFLLLKDRLHIEIIRTWGTRVVGFTLLVIGAMGIREATEAVPTPCVALENGECDVSVYEDSLAVPKKKKKIGFATFATGIIHGLQPDALMMVLPALALPSRVAGAAFLGMFLVGTVIAMGSYTVFIGSCSEALKDRIPRVTEKLTWISSLVAIALGVGIIVSQFFGFSLY